MPCQLCINSKTFKWYTLEQLHMIFSPLLMLLSLPDFWFLEMTAYSVSLNVAPFFPISTMAILSFTVVILAVITTSLIHIVLSGQSDHNEHASKPQQIFCVQTIGIIWYRTIIWCQTFIKDHSDSDRGKLLPPLCGLLLSTSSKGSSICIIP